MTINIPTASTPVTDICWRRFEKLPGDRKIPYGYVGLMPIVFHWKKSQMATSAKIIV